MSRALQQRFDAVRRTELERLKRKLGRLSDTDRASAEAIITDVIHALVPTCTLVSTAHPPTLQAIVQLFELREASIGNPQS